MLEVLNWLLGLARIMVSQREWCVDDGISLVDVVDDEEEWKKQKFSR